MGIIKFPSYSATRETIPGRRQSALRWEDKADVIYVLLPAIDEPVERKYDFVARSVEHGTLHTHDDAFVFLAKDRAVPATLRFYHQKCAALGCDQAQLDGIDRLIERVQEFQRLHHELVKEADVEPDRAAEIAGPNAPATRYEPGE